MNETLAVKRLTRRFGRDIALKDFSYRFPKKGLVAILGNSGSGKSTLLKILAGLDAGYEGSARFHGKEWKGISEAKRRELRLKRIGFVFQDFQLLENETVLSNVYFQVEAVYQDKKEDKQKRAMDLLRFVGLEGKERKTVSTLSGGEKQRAAIARSLCNDPSLLLADEPTGALDEKNSDLVFSLLKRVSASKLVIVVSHDKALVERFADVILLMNSGRLIEEKRLENAAKPGQIPTIILHKRKKKPRLSIPFLFTHAFHLAKAKKVRSLLFLGAMTTALAGLGISLFISTSIRGEIDSAFASLVPPDCIVMSPRSEGEPPLGNIAASDFDTCLALEDKYPDLVADHGSTLALDYESWFADDDRFLYQTGASVAVLTGFSMRSINDFLWLDDYQDAYVYPRKPVAMDVDEVVLGLPYQSMWTMCLSLHIERTYQSLGDAIAKKPIPLYLYARNETFGFEDEEVFSIIGIKESEYPCFYHLSHRWNREIIVDKMRFRPIGVDETPNPQYVQEIPYIELCGPYAEFLHLIRRDEEFSHLVFEPASSAYLPTVCPLGQPCKVERYYVYQADKNGVSYEQLDVAVRGNPEIKGRQIVSPGGYFATTGSVAMGFASHFFLCESNEMALTMVDAYSVVPKSASGAVAKVPNGVVDGSAYSSVNGGLRISPDLSGLRSGVPPSTCEEVAISSSLAKKFGNPSELFVAAAIFSDEVGDNIESEFAVCPLKVTGIKEERFDTLFVNDDWTVDFLLTEARMSPFSLEPYGAVFTLSKGADARKVLSNLAKEFPEYRFANPAEEVSSSLDGTLRYVLVVLIAFSAVALFTCLLLFLLVAGILVGENKGEIRLFKAMGISKGDTSRAFSSTCLLYLGVAGLGSLLLVALSQIGVRFFLSRTFGSIFEFGLSPIPLLAVVLTGLLFYVPLRCFVSLYIRKSLDGVD